MQRPGRMLTLPDRPTPETRRQVRRRALLEPHRRLDDRQQALADEVVVDTCSDFADVIHSPPCPFHSVFLVCNALSASRESLSPFSAVFHRWGIRCAPATVTRDPALAKRPLRKWHQRILCRGNVQTLEAGSTLGTRFLECLLLCNGPWRPEC